MDNTELICWKCLQRTPPGDCVHCGAALSDPDQAYEEEKEKPPKRFLEIRRRDQDNIRINLEEVIELVEDNFEVKRMLYTAGPQFIVAHPGPQLEDKFQSLLESSENMIIGFKPMVERYKKSDNLIIKYIYNEPPGPAEYRTVFLLAIFSIISVFLAGIYNYSQQQVAIGDNTEFTIGLLNVILSGPSLLHALLFTVVLSVILGVKDSIQIKSIFSNFKNNLTPFYIPAPPIFELGTFGSVNKQDHIHKNRLSMFSTAYLGPFLGWIISVLTIFFTLPLSTYNPEAASSYSDHSIIANGEFEPIILGLLVRLSNTVGLTSLDLSAPFTTLYILHPVTMAALAGFYIVTFSLFPVAHFNGGLMVRSAYGKRTHMVFTYLSIIAVYFVNWIIAILIFFIHELLKTPEILNEETELPSFYRYLMVPFFIFILVGYPFGLDIIEWIFALFS